MRLLICGVLLCLSLGLASCRKDPPPILSIICLGDGFGGADCSLADGTKVWKSPTELKDFWMTTNADMQNYVSWCYKTNNTAAVGAQMKSVELAIHAN